MNKKLLHRKKDADKSNLVNQTEVDIPPSLIFIIRQGKNSSIFNTILNNALDWIQGKALYYIK